MLRREIPIERIRLLVFPHAHTCFEADGAVPAGPVMAPYLELHMCCSGIAGLGRCYIDERPSAGHAPHAVIRRGDERNERHDMHRQRAVVIHTVDAGIFRIISGTGCIEDLIPGFRNLRRTGVPDVHHKGVYAVYIRLCQAVLGIVCSVQRLQRRHAIRLIFNLYHNRIKQKRPATSRSQGMV